MEAGHHASGPPGAGGTPRKSTGSSNTLHVDSLHVMKNKHLYSAHRGEINDPNSDDKALPFWWLELHELGHALGLDDVYEYETSDYDVAPLPDDSVMGCRHAWRLSSPSTSLLPAPCGTFRGNRSPARGADENCSAPLASQPPDRPLSRRGNCPTPPAQPAGRRQPTGAQPTDAQPPAQPTDAQPPAQPTDAQPADAQPADAQPPAQPADAQPRAAGNAMAAIHHIPRQVPTAARERQRRQETQHDARRVPRRVSEGQVGDERRPSGGRVIQHRHRRVQDQADGLLRTSDQWKDWVTLSEVCQEQKRWKQHTIYDGPSMWKKAGYPNNNIVAVDSKGQSNLHAGNLIKVLHQTKGITMEQCRKEFEKRKPEGASGASYNAEDGGCRVKKHGVCRTGRPREKAWWTLTDSCAATQALVGEWIPQTIHDGVAMYKANGKTADECKQEYESRVGQGALGVSYNPMDGGCRVKGWSRRDAIPTPGVGGTGGPSRRAVAQCRSSSTRSGRGRRFSTGRARKFTGLSPKQCLAKMGINDAGVSYNPPTAAAG